MGVGATVHNGRQYGTSRLGGDWETEGLPGLSRENFPLISSIFHPDFAMKLQNRAFAMSNKNLYLMK
jgi:hypothetical protein